LTYRELREELVLTLRGMASHGLVANTEGNASARVGELVAVSPTALPYDTLGSADICLVTVDGELVEGPQPSVELPMHLAVLARRADVGAVVHTHSPCATALSVSGGSLVPVAEAAPSGTPELGLAVLAAAGDGDAVVIRGHGPVCFGADLGGALARAVALEQEARLLT
jgi:L-fuculose-phosphate aldolase